MRYFSTFLFLIAISYNAVNQELYCQEFTIPEFVKMASMDKQKFHKYVVNVKGFRYDEYHSFNQKSFLTYESFPERSGSRIFYYLKENLNKCSGISYYFYAYEASIEYKKIVNKIISLGFKTDFLIPKSLKDFDKPIYFKKGNSTFGLSYSNEGFFLRLNYPKQLVKQLDTNYDFLITYSNSDY